ncbi:UDP-glucuronosyltransferase 2B17-like [Bombyx mandarina]|uniref:UDP-glucuronosyltransferase n=1 Tax=Bombyx mandarina TaxID=7092 RepID=A0A6J2K524_BOMMA|nr:UDP-glucuronosyltransferase 2B17-like [Bombyx mandarina]
MKLILLVCLSVISANEAARILCVFPIPSISHQLAFRPLPLELAKRGHELTVLTTDPIFTEGQSPENYTEIDVHDVSYDAWKKGFLQTSRGKSQDIFEQARVAMTVISKVVAKQLQTDEFEAVLKGAKKFDLLIIEAPVKIPRILSHILGAPMILMSSMGGAWDLYDIVGAPSHPLLYPDLLAQRLDNLTLWEKLHQLYNYYSFVSLFDKLEIEDDVLIKSIFGPTMPKLSEMRNNVELVLLTTHRIWEHNRPVPPNLIYVGGIHQMPQKELPSDLKAFLDSSQHGVIYISFGTNVLPSLLPPERIRILVKVFSELPYDVLWKWDKDELPGRSKNIRISKWLPQSDLLRHPKIKLFITQGGLQSTEEAITAGVPLIGVPMLGDQWYNVEQYVRHRIGLRLDLDELSEDKLRSFIEEIINDQSYRQNIARLRSQLYDQPQSSLERAVWWTEHVLRHGGAQHLRAAGANLSWTQYLELELVSVLLIAFVVMLMILISIILYTWKLLSSLGLKTKLKKT